MDEANLASLGEVQSYPRGKQKKVVRGKYHIGLEVGASVDLLDEAPQYGDGVAPLQRVSFMVPFRNEETNSLWDKHFDNTDFMNDHLNLLRNL